MAYGFYLKKNRRKFRKVAVQSSTPIKSVYKYGNPKAIIKRPPATTFAKKVNQIISRNVENKRTVTYASYLPVCVMNANSSVKQWYLQKDWNTKLFTLAQGVTQATRTGNQIKLKRWVIKGQITPKDTTAPDPGVNSLTNTYTGYVDLFFGRKMDNNELNPSLLELLQDGATSVSPSGIQAQIFQNINRDSYKIYYHKRFKVGMANSFGAVVAPNNDFNLVRSFGFDVTKYILKNAVIKYNDADNDPNNFMIRQLALFAYFTPCIGDMPTTNTNPNANLQTYYNVSINSYAEYEDA